jgi:hypothetical protein
MEIRENAGKNQENVHAWVDFSENMLNSGYFIAALQQISTAPPSRKASDPYAYALENLYDPTSTLHIYYCEFSQ